MKLFLTGGTGTLGQAIVKQLYDTADKIVVYSRDEAKQAAMRAEYPEGPPSPMRYRIGDVRDRERLRVAMHDCDTVIHAAALKRIDTCETEIYECLKTNILGTENVALVCNELGIKKAMFVSTDKACDALSGYGLAKAFAEHLWVQSNNYGTCNFACVRYGNVAGSKGSVHELWESRRDQHITVTHRDMTRFFWGIGEAATFLLESIKIQERGVIYVPKMKNYRMMDIAKQYSSKISVSGIRCNEKLHERLINDTDIESGFARDQGTHFRVYPVNHDWERMMTMEGEEIKNLDGITSYMPPLPDPGPDPKIDIEDILNDLQ